MEMHRRPTWTLDIGMGLPTDLFMRLELDEGPTHDTRAIFSGRNSVKLIAAGRLSIPRPARLGLGRSPVCFALRPTTYSLSWSVSVRHGLPPGPWKRMKMFGVSVDDLHGRSLGV